MTVQLNQLPQVADPYSANSYLPILLARRVLFVDSSIDGASNNNKGDSWLRPLATVEGAFNHADIVAGGLVVCGPGHSETLATAAAITCDVAGVKVLGIGQSDTRPTFNFTATAADIDITAANIVFENVIFDLTGIDVVVAGLDPSASGIQFVNCKFLMADSGGQAEAAIITDVNCSGLRILGCEVYSPDAGAVNFIRLVGAMNDVKIADCHISGDFSDAAIENPTGNVVTNLRIRNNYIQNVNAGDWAIELVSACTGLIDNNVMVSDAIATALDPGSCYLSRNYFQDADQADVAAAAFPTTTTTGTVSLDTVTDALMGANGVASWPTAAAYANAVSIAEVLGYIQDGTRRGTGIAMPANTSIADHLPKVIANTAAVLVNGTTIFTVAGGPIQILSLIAVCVTSNNCVGSTLQWSFDATDGIAATISGASASLASAAAGANVTLIGTALTTAALLNATGVNLGPTVPTICCGPGILTTTIAVGSTTGTWKHYMVYRPLGPGVTVT